MSDLKIDAEKLNELRQLMFSVPWNCGEQFVHVNLDLHDLCSGTVSYGLRYKMEMAEERFSTLDKAIEIVNGIKKRANLVPMKWDDE